MPSIKDAIQKNAARISQGEPLVQTVQVPAEANISPVGPINPIVTGLPVRGTYPPNITLHTDFQNNTQGFRTGPNLRAATFLTPTPSSTSIVAKAVAAVTAVATSLIIKVNNILSPDQSEINLLNGTGMVITTDANGNIVFNSTSSGDGLTHSVAPWESDPAYFFLRDDFSHIQAASSASVPTVGIGQLGWNFISSGVSSHGAVFGGIPPYLGQFWWDMDGTANHFGYIILPPNGTNEGGIL